MTPFLTEIEQSFKQALNSLNHPFFGEMKFDTESWQRFDCTSASKGNLNVAYKAHSDGIPVIKIQCNKCHPKAILFKYDGHSQFTPMQRQEMRIEDDVRRVWPRGNIHGNAPSRYLLSGQGVEGHKVMGQRIERRPVRGHAHLLPVRSIKNSYAWPQRIAFG